MSMGASFGLGIGFPPPARPIQIPDPETPPGPEETPEIEFASADGIFFASADGAIFAARGAT